MLRLIFYFLIAPGFLFSASIGLLSSWIDRKVTAMVQYRKGPPWYQPFADILKLLGKEIIVPEGASVAVFFGAPFFGLVAAALVSTMIWNFNLDPQKGFIGDLIVVLYLLTVPSLSAVIAGSASRNPLAAIGSSREMKLILAYELPFILAIFTVVFKTGSIIFGDIISYQAIHGMAAAKISGIIAFIVALLAVQAKLGFVPFDASEAEQEIMAGTLLEYSGPGLAMFKLTKAILLFVLPVFLITMFWGGIVISTWTGILWFIIKYVLILTAIILIKNTNPRLRIDQAVRFFWGPVTVLAAVGFLLAIIGL